VSRFDIGIAPLKDTEFNESKSYIKALEYAAVGIPCVVSKVGPYRDFVEHGVTGFHAEKPGDWKKYVGELVHNVELRTMMGKSARLKAWDYTIQGNIHLWKDAYMS
jgi:glycosyltransferase involved in cell wall biosynthesis